MINHIVISIGNSDNKLSQVEWNNFVVEMTECINKRIERTFFFGGASNWEPWQNVTWIAEPTDKTLNIFLGEISTIRERWKQDSAFVLIGKGLFV